MKRSVKHLLNYGLGLLLAAMFLWLAFVGSDWRAVAGAFIEADFQLLVLAFAGTIASIALRSWRWRLMLRTLCESVPQVAAWKFYNVGFAVNTLMPGRLGELLRPYLISRDQGISFSSSFGTVVTERIFDLLVVLLLLGSIFFFPDVLGSHEEGSLSAMIVASIKVVGFIAFIIAVASAIFLVLLKYNAMGARGFVLFLFRPFPSWVSDKAGSLLNKFYDGIVPIRGKRELALLIGSSVANWLLITANVYLALIAFGIVAPFYYCFLLVAVVALGVTVPTPASAGPYHAAAVMVVGHLWGFPLDLVRSYAIVMHLITFSPFVLFGSYYLIRGKIGVFGTAYKAEQAKSNIKVAD